MERAGHENPEERPRQYRLPVQDKFLQLNGIERAVKIGFFQGAGEIE